MIEHCILWFLLYGFLGWLYESIVVSVQQRRIVNRGFLNGPLCPIYGIGAVGSVTVLGGIANPVALFVAGAVGACVLEYFTSWLLERLFHARWWDYSNMRFNLNGRICVTGALVFGVFAIVINDFIHPVVQRWTDAIPVVALHAICIIGMVSMIVDCVITACGMIGLENNLDKVRDTLASYGIAIRQTLDDAVLDAAVRFGESMESSKRMSYEFKARVRDTAASMLNRQQLRMISAFPKLRTARNKETLDQLRTLLRKMGRGNR